MPLVTIEIIEDVVTAGQKRDPIERVADAVVAVEGEGHRDVACLRIQEIAQGDRGIGGRTLTAANWRAMAASRSTHSS